MTSSTPHPSMPSAEIDVEPVIAAFCRAVEAGRGAAVEELYAAGAVVDLTVPNWRYTVTGAGEIAVTYAGWFDHPARLQELEFLPSPQGGTLLYTMTWVQDGVPHAARHCHVFTLEGGKIQREAVFCGGRWSATLLAEMEEAARAR